MISWMQKHNKYLVWTIWVATIAFIGAGFVGWGSYSFGSKAGNVAKVGNVEISQTRLNMVYSNLYNQYNQMLGGKLDEKKAKEMGLVQQAFAKLETQAKLLNLADELGIVVSDQEVAEQLKNIPAFQKGGHFNKEIYKAYLKSQRLKAKTFEETLKEELKIQKLLALFNVDPYLFEKETVGAAMNVADKLSYKVLTKKDASVNFDEGKIKTFWKNTKENYMTPKVYDLSIVWTGSNDINVTNDELKKFYETNSFNYTDAKGKQLSFEDAKDLVEKDLQLKKSKKSAQKDYIAFKKGQRKSSEDIKLPVGDLKLSPQLWDEIQTKENGSIIKPKVVGDYYATVKINKVIPPRIKTYDEAKEEVMKTYKDQAQKEALSVLAESTLKDFNEANASVTDFITLDKNVNIKPLNKQESLQFLQKLFTSNKEKGIISVGDKIVVYKIEDQKMLPVDKNEQKEIEQITSQVKKTTFENNLIQLLDEKYPTEVYMGELKN